MRPHTPSMTRRGLLAASAGAGSLFVFAGQRFLSNGSGLAVAVASLPNSLITGFSSFSSLSVIMQMLEPLVTRNAAGIAVPCLATHWEMDGDSSWIFHLREGVKFQDGKLFSAEDVKFTFDYILDPGNNYGVRTRISRVTGVEVVDDLTVRITTDGPFPTMVAGLTNVAIEPKHYFEAVGRDGMTARPMGTGPFILDQWTPGEMITFNAFPDYWGGMASTARLVLRQLPEGSTRVSSLLTGEIAVAEELPIDLLKIIDESPAAEVEAAESSVGLILTFDTRIEEFKDPRVRRALNHAVDKQTILDRLLMGRGTVLQGQMITSNTFGHNPELEPFAYAPDKARALLAEAGYPSGFDTSITTRTGKYMADVDICNVIAAMFSEIGVRTSVNIVEQGVYSKMANARDMGPMHMVGWHSLGDADFAMTWFTKASGRSFWDNEEFEALFVAGRSSVDENVRLAAYHRMTEIMNEQCPAIFLFGLPAVFGKSSNLKDWSATPDMILRMHNASLSSPT